MGKSAIVIGSGIAGLATALRLRKKGYGVTVFETNSFVGGKLHEIHKDGYRWDAGPSLFTMPHFVDELFELFGETPQDHFQYIRKETVCNYFWEDGHHFTVNANPSQFTRQAAKTFNVQESIIQDYLRRAKEKYDLTAHVFLEKSLHRWATYLSWNTLSSLIQSYKLDVSESLHALNERTFNEPHLTQLFNRYATYNGSSPYKTPGIMSMIPHLEMHYGTFLPKGGMHAITESLYTLALKYGIHFELNSPVKKILEKNGNAYGVRLDDKEVYGDIIVSNMDIFATYQNLMDDMPAPQRILEQERSSSALIFYWGLDKKFPRLDLHNIFFSANYQKEFTAIFDRHDLSEDPTVYINITSKHEKGDAPPEGENWFVMVNAPGNIGQNWNEIIPLVRKNVIDKIGRMLNTDIENHIVTEEILDPVGIEQRTRSHRGSLYGASSNNKFAAFLRHPNFSSKIKNLYFCGGSVHPGGGIPLCLLSAKIVSDLIPEA